MSAQNITKSEIKFNWICHLLYYWNHLIATNAVVLSKSKHIADCKVCLAELRATNGTATYTFNFTATVSNSLLLFWSSKMEYHESFFEGRASKCTMNPSDSFNMMNFMSFTMLTAQLIVSTASNSNNNNNK